MQTARSAGPLQGDTGLWVPSGPRRRMDLPVGSPLRQRGLIPKKTKAGTFGQCLRVDSFGIGPAIHHTADAEHYVRTTNPRRGKTTAVRAVGITGMPTNHHQLSNDPVTHSGSSPRTRLRSMMAQPHVRPRVVIMLQVNRQTLSQMPLVQDDPMVQALLADGADQAFHVRRLPGRARRCHDFLDRQADQAAT